ncbi:MAG: efflux RND transporter periplasmic adaptor subunit [Myxococcota bacterium]
MTTHDVHHPDAMPEGEEPPPPGVKIMAVVRWVLILALGALAVHVVMDAVREHGSVEKAEHKTRYTCPMHPQVISDRPGECPICGMDLVPLEEKPKVEEAELYQCPMHPQVTSNRPGECPICGMDLVKVEKAAGKAHGETAVPGLSTVTIPLERVQRIGVRSAPAQVATLSETVRTVGVVATNEAKTAQVHARYSGWIEELLVRETGARVEAGEPLARIYSPEVLQAQQEYVTALQANPNDPLSGHLVSAAQQRLKLLGLPTDDLETLERDKRPQRTITIRAPMAGYVTQKGAVEGLYLSPGTPLFEIADLSSVWMLIDVREDQMARVQVGQKASVEIPALPGQRFEGKLTFLYPAVDPRTRTLRARVEMPNPRRQLRPGMYGDVNITLPPAKGVVVPAESVVQTGRQAYAFISHGDGVFEPRLVTLGVRTPDTVQVLSGVEPDEEVVTSAIFLIDSESRLRAAINGSPVGGAHAGHGGHEGHAESQPSSQPSSQPAHQHGGTP